MHMEVITKQLQEAESAALSIKTSILILDGQQGLHDAYIVFGW